MSRTKTLLPQDIVNRKAEFYLNITCLGLFLLVMMGTFAWFIISSRRANEVSEQRAAINARYTEAAAEIEQLGKLQEQKTEMMSRAALAASLVERVPRSVLMAELINRMPAQVSLIDFELKSERIQPIIRPERERAEKGKRLAPGRGQTLEDAKADTNLKVAPPEYIVRIDLTGVAETDQQVASFLTDLNRYSLIKESTLLYTMEVTIDGKIMREFSIKMELDRDADMRDIDPLIKPRPVGDAMSRGPLAETDNSFATETP